MKKLFASRIESTQRLFDAAGKDAREVSAAVEAYRSSSTTSQPAVVAPAPKKNPAVSARR